MAKVKAEPVDKWQAEYDARTLMDAHKIMSDPKRHEAAKKHSMEQMEAMKKIVKAKPAAAKPVAKGAKKK